MKAQMRNARRYKDLCGYLRWSRYHTATEPMAKQGKCKESKKCPQKIDSTSEREGNSAPPSIKRRRNRAKYRYLFTVDFSVRLPSTAVG